ncbi:MAG TPA: hypothetical protein VL992_17330, partial [Tepidisphaeraceae bacterium]|nr:hypothetical protein [Tepidisphaeraceae bacterium]
LHNFGKHGDFSYGIYLYAFPVQQLLVRYLPIARQPLVLTAFGFLGCLALAMLSWHFIEEPCLRLKRRSAAASAAPTAVPADSGLSLARAPS